jgi:folate-binding protein YgfZ
LWQWSEVQSGIAMVSAPIVEAFVPQMLNYESVGGVNFKKGCYPGQEVVARSQFRGTLKRRTFLVHGDTEMAAGQEVFHSSDTEQACGTVAQAAGAPAGGFDALVSMLTSAAESGELRLASAQGPLLTLGHLPYALLADI